MIMLFKWQLWQLNYTTGTIKQPMIINELISCQINAKYILSEKMLRHSINYFFLFKQRLHYIMVLSIVHYIILKLL